MDSFGPALSPLQGWSAAAAGGGGSVCGGASGSEASGSGGGGSGGVQQLAAERSEVLDRALSHVLFGRKGAATRKIRAFHKDFPKMAIASPEDAMGVIVSKKAEVVDLAEEQIETEMVLTMPCCIVCCAFCGSVSGC